MGKNMDKTGFKKIKNPETSINNRFSETVLYGEENPIISTKRGSVELLFCRNKFVMIYKMGRSLLFPVCNEGIL